MGNTPWREGWMLYGRIYNGFPVIWLAVLFIWYGIKPNISIPVVVRQQISSTYFCSHRGRSFSWYPDHWSPLISPGTYKGCLMHGSSACHFWKTSASHNASGCCSRNQSPCCLLWNVCTCWIDLPYLWHIKKWKLFSFRLFLTTGVTPTIEKTTDSF